jgi:putative colanic acid biosynthesis UDP-glucose lipid carrier transferase
MIDRRSPIKDYGSAFTVVAQAMDSAAVLIGGWLALRIVSPQLPLALVPNRYVALQFLAVALMLIVFSQRAIYDSWRGRSLLKLFRAVAGAWGIVIAVTLAALLLTGYLTDFPREWLAWWGALGFVFMILGRIIAFAALRIARERGWNHKRVVVVGSGALTQDLIHRVRNHPWTGFEISAVFDDRESAAGSLPRGVPLIEDLKTLPDYLTAQSVAEVWIALPLRAEHRVRDVMEILRHSTIDIRYVPDFFGYSLMNHAITNIAGRAMIDLSSSPIQGFNRLVKAVEDYVLATLILVLVGPLMVIVALAVKLSSPGPALFKQRRHGWDGRPIEVYKFRSMKVHLEGNGTVTQATEHDPRVTRIGAFLRRTSLDELPQFINVLEGKMSIVGPRPHAIEHGEYYKDMVDGYMKRHKVKPGITGWAQIHGHRGETDTIEKMEKRVEYDLYYINNWSLTLDLRIILRTLLRGFIGKNAY